MLKWSTCICLVSERAEVDRRLCRQEAEEVHQVHQGSWQLVFLRSFLSTIKKLLIWFYWNSEDFLSLFFTPYLHYNLNRSFAYDK